MVIVGCEDCCNSLADSSLYWVVAIALVSDVGVIHARRKSDGDTVDDATELQKSAWVTTVDIYKTGVSNPHVLLYDTNTHAPHANYVIRCKCFILSACIAFWLQLYALRSDYYLPLREGTGGGGSIKNMPCHLKCTIHTCVVICRFGDNVFVDVSLCPLWCDIFSVITLYYTTIGVFWWYKFTFVENRLVHEIPS